MDKQYIIKTWTVGGVNGDNGPEVEIRDIVASSVEEAYKNAKAELRDYRDTKFIPQYAFATGLAI